MQCMSSAFALAFLLASLGPQSVVASECLEPVMALQKECDLGAMQGDAAPEDIQKALCVDSCQAAIAAVEEKSATDCKDDPSMAAMAGSLAQMKMMCSACFTAMMGMPKTCGISADDAHPKPDVVCGDQCQALAQTMESDECVNMPIPGNGRRLQVADQAPLFMKSIALMKAQSSAATIGAITKNLGIFRQTRRLGSHETSTIGQMGATFTGMCTPCGKAFMKVADVEGCAPEDGPTPESVAKAECDPGHCRITRDCAADAPPAGMPLEKWTPAWKLITEANPCSTITSAASDETVSGAIDGRGGVSLCVAAIAGYLLATAM